MNGNAILQLLTTEILPEVNTLIRQHYQAIISQYRSHSKTQKNTVTTLLRMLIPKFPVLYPNKYLLSDPSIFVLFTIYPDIFVFLTFYLCSSVVAFVLLTIPNTFLTCLPKFWLHCQYYIPQNETTSLPHPYPSKRNDFTSIERNFLTSDTFLLKFCLPSIAYRDPTSYACSRLQIFSLDLLFLFPRQSGNCFCLSLP